MVFNALADAYNILGCETRNTDGEGLGPVVPYNVSGGIDPIAIDLADIR